MDTLTALMYILVFLFGIAVGSFLNVCMLRIPAGESVVTGPSHCPRCGRELKWYEMIPIFSFLALRGKCSGCRAPISPQYPIVEAANGLIWLLVFRTLGFSLYAVAACLLASALLVVSVIDARTREIPSGVSVAILVLGLISTLLDLGNWLSHLIGLFAISLPLVLVYAATRGRGVGGGDIKLMAGCGLFLGWKLAVAGFFFGCLLATVIHLTLMALKKAGRTLSFGPYLSAGVFSAMLWGNAFINWYLGLFI